MFGASVRRIGVTTLIRLEEASIVLARALSVSTMLFMLMDSINQLGVYPGIVAWAALYLRDPPLRAPLS